MGDGQEQYCFFCLGNENCIAINDFIKEILNVVIPKLDLVYDNEPLICTACSGKLSTALVFKSTCLNTDDTLYPYTKKEVPVDLRDIYMKEKGISISDDQKVCRLCMVPVEEEFVFIEELDVDMFQKYIPEVVCHVATNKHSKLLARLLELKRHFSVDWIKMKGNL